MPGGDRVTHAPRLTHFTVSRSIPPSTVPREKAMSRRSMPPLALGLVILAGALAAAVPAGGQTPKRGGVLNAMLTEDPPGFSIHESATISGVWPLMPCYSNLVLFDPLKSLETAETVIPELAERWSWQDRYRNLVFSAQEERAVARWSALYLEGRQVHVRHRSGGSRRPREAPPESTEGMVREHRGDRGARSPHGGLQAEAAPALAAPHARVRLLAGVPGPRPARRPAHPLHGDGPLQGQAVPSRTADRNGAEPRLLHSGSTVPRRHPLPDHQGAGHASRRAADRPARRLCASRDDEGHGGHDKAERAVARGRRDRAERKRQRGHEPQAPAVRQCDGTARDQPGHRSAGLRARSAARWGRRRRRADAQTLRDLGPSRRGAPDATGLPRAGPGQGGGQAPPRRRRVRPRQARSASSW